MLRVLPSRGKDRQRDVVEGGEVVEQVHELEAARDSRPDALGHRGVADVRALEDDLAGIGAVIGADDVAERGLAGAVRADQRDELALLDGQLDVVDGARLAEVLLQIDRLAGGSWRPPREPGWQGARPSRRCPVGSTITRTTSTTPSRSCQYSVLATA